MTKKTSDDEIPCQLAGFSPCDLIATYTYRTHNDGVAHLCKKHYQQLMKQEEDDE